MRWHRGDETVLVDNVPVQQSIRVSFFGRSPVLAANADGADAWRALQQTRLASRYVPTKGASIGSKRPWPRKTDGGPCRPDGSNCSLHNYLIAIDIEYGGDDSTTTYNKHFKTKKPDPAWCIGTASSPRPTTTR